MSPIDKQKAFYKEFKELLNKYKAEIFLENFGHDYRSDYRIVIDFQYDESFYDEYGTGIIPQLVL